MPSPSFSRATTQQSVAWVCVLLAVLATVSPNVAWAELELADLPEAVQRTVQVELADLFEVAVEPFDEDGVTGYEIIVETEEFMAGFIVSAEGALIGRWRHSWEEEEGEEGDEELAPIDRLLLRVQREFNPAALRQALAHLGRTYPQPYRNMPDLLEDLAGYEEELAALTPVVESDDEAALDRVEDLLHRVGTFKKRVFVAANPLLHAKQLLFVKRHTYQSSHFYTDFIDGCHTFGGHLCILDLESGAVRNLVPQLAQGIFGRYDLSFDAQRVVFDWKRQLGEGFRLYEVGIDGRGLRPLTFPPADEQQRIETYDNSFLGETAARYHHHTDDMHPCYLPDGGICFTSTRCEYGTLCDPPDILATAVLHRMDGDGRHLTQLTNSAVSEFSPSVMADGRILYSRWEYVDKGQLGIKCLWAMRPDGTGSVEVYGNDIPFPPTLLHGRQIPHHPHLFVALGTPHFPQSGIGTVLRIDTTRDIRTRAPLDYVTPHVDIRQEPGWNHLVNDEWIMHDSGPLYMDPYPLNDKFFLVAHNPDRPWDEPNAYGLYLLDEWGNHTLIYQDAEISCWQPMPVAPRRRPPVTPSVPDPNWARAQRAVCIVQDIYRGLEGIDRGTVKYLRIMEQIPRPWAARRFWDQEGEYGNHTELISAGSVLGLKVMHGVVPVEADGSAHFTVPADKNIYLQALDADYMELQRERTYINYRPGEVRSCVGCHERTAEVPTSTARTPLALQRPPSHPEPQPGDRAAARPIHFPTDIQPILDRHCVRCHGDDDAAAELNLTGELTMHFSLSYENIWERDLVKTFNEGSDWDGSAYAPPRSVGSHVSRLVAQIRAGCPGNHDRLPREAFIRIVTWVDANAQYYGSYYGRHHLRYRHHPDFRPVPTFADATSRSGPESWASDDAPGQ